MSQEAKEKKQKTVLKSAKRLHDPSKRKITSDRIHNMYCEFVTDDDTGEQGLWLWGTTEQGNTPGLKTLDRFNESTLEKIEEGLEFTIPFNKSSVEKMMKNISGNTKFYVKDGVTTTTISKQEFLAKLEQE